MKKMNLIILILSLFLFVGNVNAEENLKCTYGSSASFYVECTINNSVLNCIVQNKTSGVYKVNGDFKADIMDFVEDSKYYCPPEAYATVDGNTPGGPTYSNMSFVKRDGGTIMPLSANSGVGNSVNYYAVTSNGNCPLGPHVTQDLYGALKIFKIVAPILCIALSIVEIVKSIAKGDAEGEMKKIYNRFLKRLALTIILFFLPVLVDATMQVLDVWDGSGHCEIIDLLDNDLEKSKEKKCFACTSDGKYYWGAYADLTKKCNGSLAPKDAFTSEEKCERETTTCWKCDGKTYYWGRFSAIASTGECTQLEKAGNLTIKNCSTGGFACYRCTDGIVPLDEQPHNEFYSTKTTDWILESEKWKFNEHCINRKSHRVETNKDECHD